jgi:hypothetical protein
MIVRVPHVDHTTTPPTFENTQIPATFPGLTLITMNLAAGSYMIEATAEVRGNVGQEYSVDCQLVAGSDEQDSALAGTDSFITGGIAQVSAAVLHTFAAPGSVTYTCGASLSQPASWAKVWMTAVQVQSVSTTLIN